MHTEASAMRVAQITAAAGVTSTKMVQLQLLALHVIICPSAAAAAALSAAAAYKTETAVLH